MATVDEILNSLEATATPDEPILAINSRTRKIDIPETVKIAGVESDERTQRVHFDSPSAADNDDLSKYRIHINYLTAAGKRGKYEVQDITVNGERMSFSWKLSRTATESKGDLKFVVCMKKYDSQQKVVNEWNTTIATLIVLEGIEVDGTEITEKYPDILEQWKQQVDIATAAANTAKTNADTATTAANTATTNANTAANTANLAASAAQDIYNKVAGTDLGGLVVGGTNLIKNSAKKRWSLHSGATPTYEENIAVPEWGATDATRVKTAGGTNTIKITYPIIPAANVLVGSYYAQSIWIKNEGPTPIQVNHNGQTSNITVSAGEAKRCVAIFKAVAGPNIQWNIMNTAETSVIDMIYWRPQLEQGTVATDWSPAPEDMATKEELKASQDNLVIGGRNILTDSNNFKNIVPYQGAAITFEENVTVPEWGAVDATRVKISGGTSTTKAYKPLIGVSTAGQRYVLSVWIRNEGTTAIRVSDNLSGSITVSPGEAKRIIFYSKGDGVIRLQMNLTVANVTDNISFVMWHAQIEHGTVATDWTPAPEDIVTKIELRTVKSSTLSCNYVENHTCYGVYPTYAGRYGNARMTASFDTDGYLKLTWYTGIDPFYELGTSAHTNLIASQPIKPGDTVTFSFDLMGNNAAVNAYRTIIFTSNGTTYSEVGTALTASGEGRWQRYSITRTVPADATNVFFRVGARDGAGKIGDWLKIKNVMIEKGDTASEPVPKSSEIVSRNELVSKKDDLSGLFVDDRETATTGYWHKIFDCKINSYHQNTDINITLHTQQLMNIERVSGCSGILSLGIRQGQKGTFERGSSYLHWESATHDMSTKVNNFAINVIPDSTGNIIEFYIFNKIRYAGYRVNVQGMSGRTMRNLTFTGYKNWAATTTLTALPTTGTIIYSTLGHYLNLSKVAFSGSAYDVSYGTANIGAALDKVLERIEALETK